MLPPLSPALVRTVVYPLYRGFRGDRLLAHLEELEKNQWLPAAEIEDIGWRRTVELLRYAAEHVPYYRDVFKELGRRPEDLQAPADLLDLPLLTKEIIRREGKRMLTEDPLRSGYASNTSGSTGEPLYFHVDNAAGPMRRANTLRCLRWAGIDIGSRQAYVWGFPFGRTFKQRAVFALQNYFNNTTYLSSFDLSEERMHDYARAMRTFKPELVIGYPSAITTFAEFCKAKGIDWIRPRAVMSSGERMWPHQRDTLAAVFNAPVFDRYGSNEFANVAHECSEHRGLHVMNDLLRVEVIREGGRPAESGEMGEIVVTDLLNRYMPFIRYRTGDLAVQTVRRCACGRGLPLLERIEGRTFDIVVTPDGRSVGGYFWTYLSRTVPGIKAFQIEQRERSRIIFRMVPGPDWREESKGQLVSSIRANMGESVQVDFDVVSEIPLSRAGKFKFIISKIEERLVVKSKVHKATVTAEDAAKPDCLIVDEEILELSNIAPYEKVLVVDNTNGTRLEAFVLKGRRGSGEIVACGAAARDIRAGDEIILMAFTWSDEPRSPFVNILVDRENKFVRYLTEVAGMKL